jgi:hypothetical protein
MSEENVTTEPVETEPSSLAPTDVEETSPPPAAQPQMKLTDVPITNENVSLNVMISFLNVAQKRGAFTFDESAKIWECIQVFVKANAAASASN